MKKLLIVAVGCLSFFSSCRTKCPAYSATKPATQVAAPIMASTEQQSARQ
ncbi:hypothetical protein [Hymenobacter chitinivorans]|uniref:Lipoprotein n=1 Tax=Hymenobacter chitinivorans DSM 11115 TaxID=1121954 RepID=A0A2M9BTP6_9BACT|nr:hypothetical protein [Hymenobacter chitinivorans]PJJ61282.1 hypothetical protein CLV45_2720 [Hymenobacter chitinivorans DSM 11115]